MTPREATIVEKLQRALQHAGGLYGLDDVLAEARAGRAQIWERGDTVAVTELLRYPRATAVRYWLVGGHAGEARTLLPEIEAWAREQGATRAEATGRHGWRRLAAAHGYEPVATQFAKVLT